MNHGKKSVREPITNLTRFLASLAGNKPAAHHAD